MRFKISETDNEIFVSVQIEANNFTSALEGLVSSYHMVRAGMGLTEDTEVWIRLHLSDIANQYQQVIDRWDKDKTSFPIIIGQTPVDSSFVSLLAYHIKSDSLKKIDHSFGLAYTYKHGDYTSYLRKFYPLDKSEQNQQIMRDLREYLKLYNISVDNGLIRTWFYLRDIENTYSDFVNVRKDAFDELNLTENTHYIASTGIGATPSYTHWCTTSLITLSMEELEQKQIQYLKAVDFLSPTSTYGVTFERGTKLSFGDRDRIYISGTASINANGNVLYVGDALSQTKKIVENMSALLQEGDMVLSDMKYLIVYLRDFHLYSVVSNYIEALFPDTPTIFVQAPVCREEWLVEIEGEAIKSKKNKGLKSFI